jgi:hypothetical protein
VKGLNELSKNLDQLSRALKNLDGEIAKLSFNPHDKQDVDRAIREMERKVDAKAIALS